EKRIKERSRNNKQKWSEDNLEYLKKLNGEFYKYYHNFKDLKPVYLVDASGTVEETCEKIEKIIFR
ncbi:MAG: deoxynucleoside kinase, partial [Candidatus Aenigmarchaeota archaeon]|nr:deoxynucleoside kinase [Candidatus Aenigmarchaeota archaeon]